MNADRNKENARSGSAGAGVSVYGRRSDYSVIVTDRERVPSDVVIVMK